MLASILYLSSLLVASPSPAPNPIPLLVRGGERRCANVVVTAAVSVPNPAAEAVLRRGGEVVPCQARRERGKLIVSWIAPELGADAAERYELTFERPRPRPAVVSVKREGANIEVRVGDRLFARYDATTGPNKPYFHPIYGPGERLMVRGYPVAKVDADTSGDHPHHRGLWFTHGDVDAIDFWSEGGKTGTTANTGYAAIVSGPVFGGFTATTDWVAPDGVKIAEDTRTFTFYATDTARIMDVDVSVRPVGKELVFGDTKEGSFGLRIPDSMIVTAGKGKKGEGHILTATGLRDGATWGKPAEWVDCFGPVGGETMGIAIFDHPANPRHPTTWHVRDYGLFAANPFGLHDFVPGQARDAGRMVVPVGGSVTFRYRVVFHVGEPEDARIADMWSGYAQPPTVTVGK